jgi:CO dehydrogenase/acetyl-CoA synthase beta subunit
LKAFDQDITRLRKYIAQKREIGQKVRCLNSQNGEALSSFSGEGKPSIVLREDTWVELGNPETASLAVVLLTESLALVNDGAISLVGPDIQEAKGMLPFAQILLVGSTRVKDEDYRKLNSAQYALDLKGYMIKSLPSRLSIWGRVSKDSVQGGLSFAVLGNALVDSLKSRFDLQSLEVIFVTSSEDDVKELGDISHKARRILGAMNKMVEELSFNCSSCEYSDVCSEVLELKKMRQRLLESR